MRISETVISVADLRLLPEYSCSLPTGTVVGKRWRRMLHHGATQEDYPLEKREWQIGEYVPHRNPSLIGIKWSWALDEDYEPHRGPLK